MAASLPFWLVLLKEKNTVQYFTKDYTAKGIEGISFFIHDRGYFLQKSGEFRIVSRVGDEGKHIIQEEGPKGPS